MRYSRNIFEGENYRGAGVRTVSAETVVASILTVLSALAVVFIIANFDEITAMIAIWMAGFLTSVFPILVFAVIITCFVVITKRRARRRFWRW
ncbi:hypothetical protein [[Ruminococcus] torques]|uniref:hypothetical protein n=1 Tax=[Ruminococcus] torques TaxID=33039 RepID=UPI0025A40891|nr:hypothetical protein [[Ruminococcus] torques]MDM8237390.1 hypothetical protein [[Ruminococcus] torques]